MQGLTLGLIQMRCEKGLSEVNIKEIERYVKKCSESNVDIACFPEMSITGYIDPSKYPHTVLTRDDPEVQKVAQLSKLYDVTIIAGFVEKNPEGKPYITQFFAEKGEVRCFYRKVTVKDEEADWFSPGDEVGVFSYSGSNFGISICADIDDMNIFRELAQKGVRIVFECAAPGLYGEQETRNWQSGFDWWKSECNNKLGKYASENNIYVAVSTQAGRTVDEDFPGGGYVFSPEGECIFETDNWEEGLLIAHIPKSVK